MQTPRLRQHCTTGHIGKRCIEAMSLFARVLNTELQNIPGHATLQHNSTKDNIVTQHPGQVALVQHCKTQSPTHCNTLVENRNTSRLRRKTTILQHSCATKMGCNTALATEPSLTPAYRQPTHFLLLAPRQQQFHLDFLVLKMP